MKLTRLAIAVMAVLAILGGTAASADSTADQNAVAALDAEYQLAVKNNDADTMARILSDDFVLILGTGQTYTKTALLNQVRAKEVVYEENEESDKTVRVWGDNAVVTSKLYLKGVDKGKPFEWHVWFSDTYARTSSGWRYVNGFASLPLEMLPSSAAKGGGAEPTPAKDAGAVPGILPTGYGETVDNGIRTIRGATAQFKTTDAAEAAGYKRVTGCVQHPRAGAMGYHFQNNDLLDTTLDLEHPEVLVYEKMPDGTFQLNGVEFLVPISAWKSTDPPRIMGQALMKVDSIGFWFLHVWTWKPSPSGLFAPWNPDVKCLETSSMSH